MKIGTEEIFAAWLDALERRHMSNLTFQEIRRGVQALSAIYVEQRGRIDAGAALQGEGKRAAFAMFYAPLHFLLVQAIVRALNVTTLPSSSIWDLGCGTGSAGAAWALECRPQGSITGIDRNAWALQECRWTYQTLGLRGLTRSVDIRAIQIPRNAAILAAFTINELDTETRDRFLAEFLKNRESGFPILVIEPIARRLTKWWDEWATAFISAGGRADEWRFQIELPEKLKLMDRAAGLNHQELTGRSLCFLVK